MERLVNTADLVDVLESHGIRLYHANYPSDVREYVKHEGICSRAVLSSIPGMTDFGTDERDKRLGLLHKVTLNTLDLGFSFGRGEDLPNPYGPVLFVFSPQAVLYADQCEVLLTPRFDQPSEARVSLAGAMRSSEEVSTFLSKHSRRTAWGHTLQTETMNLEIVLDCSVLPFDALQHIIVDPIEYADFSLLNWVREILPEFSVVTRDVCGDAKNMMQGLIDCAAESENLLGGERLQQKADKQQRLHFLLGEYAAMLREFHKPDLP